MRILVHEYCGHPFPVQLSRWLAAQGHDVLHAYSADFPTLQGALVRADVDPPGLDIEGVGIGRPLAKYQLVRRRFQERAYARRLTARMAAFGPDVVLSGTTPPEVQRVLLDAARKRGARFVSWLQDIYSVAGEKLVRDKIPLLGGLAAAHLRRMEFAVYRRSDAVVAITEDFVPLLAAEGVARDKISVIENWAPLGEIAPLAKDNAWARRHGLAGRFVFLYAGTLGLKHNPGLLSALAEHFRDDPEVAVVVVSEGLGRDWLEQAKAAEALDNLVLLDFQPYGELSQVLASADVLVSILEPYAGVFSVPSKVLSYLCTGRALLAAIPAENLAARMIESIAAGLIAPPEDEPAFLAAARRLRTDPQLRAACAAAGGAHAETAFDIEVIGQRFLGVMGRGAG